MSRCLLLTISSLIFVMCCDNSGMTRIHDQREIEVSPGKWLSVALEHKVHLSDVDGSIGDPHRLSPSEAIEQLNNPSPGPSEGDAPAEESRLSFEWAGKKVAWQGKEIPVTLREYDGLLFLVGFNREELHHQKLRMVFFGMNENGTGFDRISPGGFPRQIATQNMWMSPGNRYSGTSEGRLDEWKLLRELNFHNRYFASTLTARIWYQIEHNCEEYVANMTIPQEFVLEYAEKYQPVPLPTIVRDE